MRSASRAGDSRRKSTSRPTSKAIRSTSISPAAKPATARSSKPCSTSAQTSNPERR
jgi:hypothetical protein